MWWNFYRSFILLSMQNSSLMSAHCATKMNGIPFEMDWTIFTCKWIKKKKLIEVTTRKHWDLSCEQWMKPQWTTHIGIDRNDDDDGGVWRTYIFDVHASFTFTSCAHSQFRFHHKCWCYFFIPFIIVLRNIHASNEQMISVDRKRIWKKKSIWWMTINNERKQIKKWRKWRTNDRKDKTKNEIFFSIRLRRNELTSDERQRARKKSKIFFIQTLKNWMKRITP